ncbi:MAG: ATP-binding protein [Chloroflexi bacterium]|nr:ATP-binding protein [Chloroflexota bacterium]MDA1298335.1 ATP-binding protein [Chloroflexota bacterium]
MVIDACEAVAPLATASGISLEWPGNAKPLPEPIKVSGDSVLIRLIVLSLLDNAIKYGQEGCTITVELDGSGPFASVRVRDTGPGIPPEHLERVFDRFYRVDRARSRKTGGTGLGLAIARRAAEVIDGQLSLASDEKTGTVATARFRRSGR